MCVSICICILHATNTEEEAKEEEEESELDEDLKLAMKAQREFNLEDEAHQKKLGLVLDDSETVNVNVSFFSLLFKIHVRLCAQ